MRDETPDTDAELRPAVNERKADHISLLSHDIRAAMSDVIGGLRLVDMKSIPPETRVQLERVRSSGEALARLLEDALAAAFDGSDTRQTVRGHLNLGRLMHDLESRWSGRAAELGLTFRLMVDEAMPLIVSTDRMALDRILANLLSNALKYTEAGTVRLTVSLLDGCDLRFSVVDDGPGFSDDALARLFQRSGRPSGAKKPGSGLGLHIAKELADNLGGRLSVSNAEGSGAEVTLVLPRAAWKPHLDTPVRGDLPDLTGMKILVAEDNPTNQALVTQMLDAMGAETELAQDGVEALNWLTREDFDLALIDIEMPRLDGLEVFRAARQRGGRVGGMPLIALTAYVLRANREAIYAAGADGIVAKPIMSLDSFGEALSGYVRAASPVAEAAAEATDGALDRTQLEHLLQIAGEDGARELLSRLQSDLTRVRESLASAVQRDDHATVRADTHVLISLAGALGAERLLSLVAATNAAVHRGEPEMVTRAAPQIDRKLGELLSIIETEHRERTGTP